MELVGLPVAGDLRAWAVDQLNSSWGGVVARRGALIDPRVLPGFVAVLDGERVGLATFEVVGPECEVVTIDATVKRMGVGQALVGGVAASARELGADALWLVTTNDNTDAIAFYSAVGFALVARRDGAVDDARCRLKPSIPLLGLDGIPIRDELEFRLPL